MLSEKNERSNKYISLKQMMLMYELFKCHSKLYTLSRIRKINTIFRHFKYSKNVTNFAMVKISCQFRASGGKMLSFLHSPTLFSSRLQKCFPFFLTFVSQTTSPFPQLAHFSRTLVYLVLFTRRLWCKGEKAKIQ